MPVSRVFKRCKYRENMSVSEIRSLKLTVVHFETDITRFSSKFKTILKYNREGIENTGGNKSGKPLSPGLYHNAKNRNY